MPLQYEVVDGAHHDALPRRKRAAGVPDWDRVMDGLAQGHAVHHAVVQERRTLARSVGRRAVHRVFRVGIRHGADLLPVRKVADIPQGEPDQGSEPTKSGLWGEQEVVEAHVAGSAS